MSNIDKQAIADDESAKTYYIHPMAFGSTQNPGYGHVAVVKAEDFEKLRTKLEAAENRIAEHDRKCDEQYLLGMRAGWNFGTLEDADGFDTAYASRSKIIESDRTASSPKGE